MSVQDVESPRSYPFSADRLEVDPAYHGLRRGPLVRVQLAYGEPAWLATRHADVRTVLGDARFSRAAAMDRDEPRSMAFRGGPEAITSLDPPDHSRLRRLVTHAFTVRRIEHLRPRAEQIVDELIDTMQAAGAPADLVDAFALPLPTTVICELLGVPVADRTDFRRWTEAFLSTTRHTAEEAAESYGYLVEYFARLIAQRRAHPTDDLLGAMVTARDAGDRLSEDELLALAVGLLSAGHETTASQIPNAVWVLLRHPEQAVALRADPALVPQAVEEVMRWVPLANGALMARYALEDVDLGGVTVRAGEPVVVSLPSANRDEEVYPDPDRFDVHRQAAAHVGFGHGAHHCLGAPLARMELQVALAGLLRRLPGLALAGTQDDVTWKAGGVTRGPERMLVRW